MELLQIGGQAYWLKAQGMQAGDTYQPLTDHVLAASAHELVVVGLPSF